MAEKRVSVRLVATGGRQVRAELEGVGEAGARGFGRLSREMDLANARVAAFARRATLAAAAATAALAAAGAAMIRSGLQNVDAQAKLAQSLGTTVASIQPLERAGELAGVSMSGIEQATKDLTRRLSQAAAGTGPAADALDRLGLSANELIALPLDQRVGAINAAIEDFVPVAERAAIAGQLFGEEGSIAMSRIDTATLRQATEDVLAFGVVVSEQDADQIERTNDAISRLGLIWRSVSNQLAVAAAPALEAVANALASVARTTGPLGIAIRGLFDNIGRLTTYAATFAGLMAGRWVAGMAAAALSVRGVATALVMLRGALIRTGIGALIVGAGELVFQFTRLMSGAGGFGEAMGLLKDVAVEVWNRISLSAVAAWARVESSWATAQAGIYDGLQTATDAVTRWANATINTFEGAFLAVQAIWGALPEVFDRIGTLAINGLVEVMETGIAGVTEAINTVLTLGGRRPDWAIAAPDLSAWKSVVPEAVDLGDRARAAYDCAFADDPFEAPDLFGGMAEGARGRAAGYSEAAGMLSDAAARPMTAWQALRDAMRGSDEDGADALTEATAAADRLEAALGEAGSAATDAGAAAGAAAAAATPDTNAAATGWQAITAALSDYASKAREIGGDIGQSLVGAFQSAENAVGQFVKTGKLDFRDLTTSLLADLAKLAARRFILGPIANALSGALGGIGGGIFADILHAGGMVGAAGQSRMVPAMAFAAAPRMHSGGVAGLRHDEVPAILQRGERVLSRREAQSYGGGGGVNVTIMARDAESFRQSRTQVAADIARAVSLGRRGM
ncbi:phage tail tape measure C-terminal domain-containing protein [Oceaniglobus indicus]|uniref:phage tail tape measure C-terminal domain-containing protein n=1 Tax=Oceaniglobus indicus TaxID=2047749 RepID=UPI000C174318|nr:phage tail tape measure C-terminal domain-containing protein [Oceaniglobus indicus]